VWRLRSPFSVIPSSSSTNKRTYHSIGPKITPYYRPLMAQLMFVGYTNRFSLPFPKISSFYLLTNPLKPKWASSLKIRFFAKFSSAASLISIRSQSRRLFWRYAGLWCRTNRILYARVWRSTFNILCNEPRPTLAIFSELISLDPV